VEIADGPALTTPPSVLKMVVLPIVVTTVLELLSSLLVLVETIAEVVMGTATGSTVPELDAAVRVETTVALAVAEPATPDTAAAQ